MIAQWSREVFNYIQQYMNHSPLPYIYLVSLAFLCVRGKDKRRTIVYPSLLLMAVILNPFFYGYLWLKLITYAFWRMLWMIPVIPVILCALSELAKLINKKWAPFAVTAVFLIAMFLYGSNIYSLPGAYVKAENAYKLPEASVQVGEKLLELEEEPVVVAPSSLYCYLRQYSGKIRLVYGRDADGYIQPIEDAETQELISLMRANGGDTARLITLAKNKGANLIVLPENHTFALMEEFGFKKAAEVCGMMIYQVDISP